MNSTPGTIVVLNGTSSAGKTSLLQAIQATFPEPFLDAGLDKLLWMLPPRYRCAPLWNEVLGQATRSGPEGHRLVQSMHNAIAALSRSGGNVVADHVLVESAWLRHCTAALQGLPTLFVGVVCTLAVLDERERTRMDRTLGQAKQQLGPVHQGAHYDLVLDTSTLTPEEGAAAVARHLSTTGANRAFNSGACSAAQSLAQVEPQLRTAKEPTRGGRT